MGGTQKEIEDKSKNRTDKDVLFIYYEISVEHIYIHIYIQVITRH